MYYFGCVMLFYEGLEILKIFVDGCLVVDVGFGNGYWVFMLWQYGLIVYVVDNMQSEWRVNWVIDILILDGVKWLVKNQNGKDMVFFFVYFVVGGGVGGGIEGGFMR